MIAVDQILTVVTSAQFVDNVIRYCGITGIILSVVSNLCSYLANYIPDPQEENIRNVTAKFSKIVNFIAINIKSIKKV